MNSTMTDLLFSLHARFPGLMEIAISLAKGVAIICLMWALALLLRHRSAVARAWVWRCGFVALLLLAAWPYRPMVLSALTLEVNVPTEAVVVSHSAVRVKPVIADGGIVDAKAPPLVIEKDTSAAAVAQRLLRKLDPWTVTAWWMGFVALLGMKMSRAWVGVRHLRRDSRQASCEVQEACARIAKVSAAVFVPEVRVSSVIGSPLLTGSHRAVIWLPENSAEWSEAKLEAVLHHEIAHLARRDGRWQWIATAAACFWWWNPAVWFALARLKAEAEQAADEVVVTRKVSASDYAQALIEIASTWLPRSEPALGVPMLGMSEIERRVRELLRDHPWRGRLGAMATSAIAMLAVLASGIVLVSCKQQPAAYISIAKLVAGGRMVAAGSSGDLGVQYQDYLQDFYGTIIETLESSEMRRRALDRVRALHPDMKDVDVSIAVRQNKGSAVFNVVATGQEPKSTRICLDALLDEFIAFRNQIREQQRNKALTTLAEDVVRREKTLQEKHDKLLEFEKAANVVILNRDAYTKQSQMKLLEERDSSAASAEEIAVLLEDIKLGVELREAKLKTGSRATATDQADGLTLNEREYLQTQLLVDRLTLEKNKPLKTSDPQSATDELDEKLSDASNLLKFYEGKIRSQWKNQQAAISRRLTSLDGLIKIKEKEAIELAAQIATHDGMKKDYEDSKKAYSEILDLVRRFTVSEDMTSDHVTIMERASAAVEDVPKGWFGTSSSKVQEKKK